MKLENLKIGTRLNLAFGLLVILIVALLTLAFFSLTSMDRSVDGITKSSESIRWANNVRSNVQKANASIMAMVIVNSEQTRVEQKKTVETAQKLYQQDLGKLEKASGTGRAKELIAKLKEAIAAGAKDNAKVVELVESDLPDLAMGTFVGNMPMLSKITELCDAIVNNQEQQNEAYEKAARGSYSTARNFLFAMGAIILGIAVMVALLLTRSIVKPLQRGVDAANRLASGDLTATVEVTGKDELSCLLGAIGNTTLSLRAIMGEIKNTADGLTSTSVQLSANSTEMSENARGQANRATQVAAAGEEMTQTVMDVARNTSTIASSAAGTAATAEKGEESVGRTVTEISAIADTAKESTRIVEALGNQSQQICDIIGVISDIADQTNLLALNAAIEAARAGEHGRGFAVVADEVRKLAEKTAGATHEIEQTIGSITSNVEKAVSAMKQTLTKVDSGVRLSRESGTALRDIVTAVGELQGMIDQIASAAEEMSATSDEIARDIEGIAHAAKDNSSNAEQTAESSVIMSQLAVNLQTILVKFTL